MQFTDSVDIGNTRRTRDGYLVVDAKIARTGIQTYLGSEMGKPNMDYVRVYRPEDEVFHHDAMSSFAFRPVTNDHPDQLVDARNWRKHSVGTTGDTIARDGEFLRVPFTLQDADTIKAVADGKRELSAGYTAEIEWKAGKTSDGQAYDAIQRNIRGNHLAVVDAARAGPQCRIGDSWSTPDSTPQHPKEPVMPDNLRAVLVDGISIQVTDQGAQAIEKLQRQLADSTASLTASVAAKDAEIANLRDQSAKVVTTKDGEIAALRDSHTKVIEAKDGEIAGLKASHTAAISAKDGEIAALKSSMPDAAQMDAMLAQRSSVIDAAKGILGDSFDPKGKSLPEIRRAAVVKRLGDTAVADKSDDYVAAAFDTLTALGGTTADPIRDAFRAGVTQPPSMQDSASTAFDSHLNWLSNAWKNQTAEKV